MLCHLYLSPLNTSLLLKYLVGASDEAVLQSHARCRGLFTEKPRHRRAIAVDESKAKVQGEWLYVWAAVDVETWEVLCTWVSQGRSGLEAISFLRKALALCDGQPMVYVDGAPWYRVALTRLGVPREHRTFGPRNPVEQWFGILKQRVKRFYRRWPHNADLQRVNEWVRSYVNGYHVKRFGGSLC